MKAVDSVWSSAATVWNDAINFRHSNDSQFMHIDREKLKAALLALTAYAIFTIADATVKLQAARFPLSQVTFTISAFAIVFLLIHAQITGRLADVVPKTPKLTILRAILLGSETAMIYYSFSQLPMPQVYTLAFLTPIFVPLIAFFGFGDRMSPLQIFAVVLGFAGVVLALRPGATVLLPAHFIAIASAFIFAVTLIMIRKAAPRETDKALALMPFVVMAVGGLAFTLAFDTFQPMDLHATGVLALGAAAGYFANLLLVRAFRLGHPALVAPFQYSQIIWGTLVSFILFGTGADIFTAAGAVLIIISGLLVLK